MAPLGGRHAEVARPELGQPFDEGGLGARPPCEAAGGFGTEQHLLYGRLGPRGCRSGGLGWRSRGGGCAGPGPARRCSPWPAGQPGPGEPRRSEPAFRRQGGCGRARPPGPAHRAGSAAGPFRTRQGLRRAAPRRRGGTAGAGRHPARIGGHPVNIARTGAQPETVEGDEQVLLSRVHRHSTYG